ncbi:bifunctional folylpolyglutamate synthase/dihydrofolate synthase [Bacillus songklensis]|uniref:tetrahydrofolate synthase n=1 Tax=Bacillus songklensis TaxID=1069116 RepID=A0ABV8AYN3_9BACI
MMETYNQALNWIRNRLRFGIKPGLERMAWMLEQLGNPHDEIKAIHVAGTNGKGSTVCYLRNILQQAGNNVGTFTSPYIETFNERISVNGRPICDEEMAELVNTIKPVVEGLEETDLGEATEFEVITIMAFYYFGKMNKQDFVIFETGLGGRLDSTNVVQPILTIITNIGFDHMHILGETVEEITEEKAGIIKPGIPLISAVEQKEAREILTERTNEKQSPFYLLEKEFHITSYETLETGEKFSMETPAASFHDLRITMMGYHQVKNASLAVMAAVYLKNHGGAAIEERHIQEGLVVAKWIGRFEKVSEHPTIIIDGAHNFQGIESLVSTLRLHYEDKNIHVIFSCLKDKDAKDMIEKLQEVAASITFTSFDFPRAYEAKDLHEMAQGDNTSAEEDWYTALREGKEKLKTEKDLLMVTGSLYFISEVRKAFV